MRAFLLILGLLMVVALSALFAGPVLVDWNAYRGSFEKQATALLGREVRVGGNASLRLLPAPYMHFDNVRIADQTGRFDNPLIRVEGFTIWLSVAPLLRGAIEAREIELDGPDIRLSVDKTGKANWQGLAPGHLSLPFMPTEVSLASVKIRNGKLSILKSASAPLFSVEGIDGELAAVDLEGPYRFKGSLSYEGARRDVRVSTAAIGAEHSLKVKTVVRVPETSNAYTFDGDLLDLDRLPRLAGSVEAQFGLSAEAFAQAAEGETKPAGTTMRLTGALEADLERAALTDLNVTFDSDGRPQLVTGEIGFEWKQRPAISARLAARWLDLDRISGKPAAEGPLPALQGYAGRFLSAFAANAETRVVATIDQANLGGDLIGSITLDARRTPSGIEIAQISAQLPGATTLDVSGVLAEADGGHRFAGPVRLSGASLAKLLKWVMPGVAVDGKSAGGFFMMGAKTDIGAAGVALDDLTLEIDRSRIAGSLRYAAGEQRSLTLNLGGDRLDLSEVVAEAPDLAGLLAGWSPGQAGAGGTGGGASLLGLAASLVGAVDADIALSIGDLKTAAGRLENVELKMRRAGGRVDLETLSFRTGGELGIEATGSASGSGEAADGLLRFRVEAPTQSAVAALDRFLALPPSIRDLSVRYALRAPLRIAGTLRQDAAAGRVRSEIALDGNADGERMRFTLRGEDSLLKLSGGQADMTLAISDKDGARLLTRLAGRPDRGEAATAISQEPQAPGELTIRASGIPNTELTTVAKLAAAGLTASFDGKISLAGDARRIEGRIAMAASPTQPLLEALGVAQSSELASSLALAAQVTAAGTEVAIEGLDARVDGNPVSGSARVAAIDGVPRLDVTLKAGRLRLPALLAPMLAAEAVAPGDASLAEAADAVEAAPVPAGEEVLLQPEAPTQWSDRPFRLSLLEGWTGRLRLEAASLEIVDGLSLEDARVTAATAAGGVTIEKLEGNALGGAILAGGALKREAAGASLSLEASIAGAELEEIFVDEIGRSKAKGRGDARLSVSSSGLTPRGMIAVLEGRGLLEIRDALIIGLSPVTVDQAARTLLEGEAKLTQDAIAQAIGASRQSADFPLGSLSTKLSVVDGTLRAEQVEIGAPQSTIRLKGLIDLDSFLIESDWTISPKPVEPLKAPLPGVSIVYAGPLAQLRTLAAEADVEALERELLARRLIGGEEQLQGLWPDAPDREGAALVPDPDRVVPIPADETVATVPPSEPAETVPGATAPASSATKSTIKVKTAVEIEAAVSAPPKPAPAGKPKRRVKRKTVTIREGDNVGVR